MNSFNSTPSKKSTKSKEETQLTASKVSCQFKIFQRTWQTMQERLVQSDHHREQDRQEKAAQIVEVSNILVLSNL